ncbi:VWA domain-containing protein [Methanococcus voltae]|uniref:Magnesium chelatase subunit D n=1 Tax=Methanococcus voltae TaxID=2188 RepID=A0A8J7UT48_METVO|nr:magnesium chelatase subunit D [Methanococcus voltae]MBP2201309.1 magnesium chelatase subunit D [Methanococcus voltae]
MEENNSFEIPQNQNMDENSETEDEENEDNNNNENSNNQNTSNNIFEEQFGASGKINPKILDIKLNDRIERYSSGKRVSSYSSKGSYVKYKSNSNNDIAFDATIKASAPYQKFRRENSAKNLSLYIESEDMKYKVKKKNISTHIMFGVDASGSMGVLKRMEASKGAIVSLLMDAYQNRDKVSMVAFRKDKAELVVPFTNSVELAEANLIGLKTGGRTPLYDAFTKAYETFEIEMRKNPNMIPILVMISDFKPNVNINKNYFLEICEIVEKLLERSINLIFIDTEKKSFVKIGIGEKIAKKYGIEYYNIENLTDNDILDTLVR